MRRILASVFLVLGGAAAAAQNPQWPIGFPPGPLPQRAVKFPDYEIRTLPNGLQVMAVLHHEQPVVSIRMIVRAGSALDPRGKQGLANVASALLTQGTATRSAGELNDLIDFIGGEMGAGSQPDLTSIHMVVMKDSFETGLQVLSEMARRPAFAQEELDRQRQQMLSGLQVSFEDPGFVADAVFNRLVYGFHPYGMLETGTPETLAAITRDDLLAYHRQHFVPNNAILAVVGDVTADEAFEGVRKVFGDWERRTIPAATPPPPPDPTRRVIVINKPDAVQTEVRVGHLGIRRNQNDYMPLNLAMRILGGEGANRLHQILRTDRGLTYGAQADMRTLKDTGDLVAETSTRSDATGEVLRLIVEQIQRLQRERVNDRELADAKAYLTGSFPLTIETPDAIATQVLNVLFFGLPVEQLQSFRERVNAVTPLDIERVARYYLQPDRLSVVLVGNAAAFSQQLRGVGFGNFEVIDMANLDLTAADFKRAPRRADGRPGDAAGAGPRYRSAGAGRGFGDADTGRRVLDSGVGGRLSVAAYQAQPATQGASAPSQTDARALLDQLVAAKGGEAALRGIKTLRATTKSSMTVPDGNVEAEVITYIQYPDRLRVETHLPDQDLVQVFDGTRGWVRESNVTRDVPSEVIRELQAGFRRDTVPLLLSAVDGKIKARQLPDVRRDGRVFRTLELSDLTLEPLVLHIDPATGLIARQVYLAGGPGRALIEEEFDDYREVDGVQIAFTARVRAADRPPIERKVTEIRINAPLEARLFTRPAS